MSPHVVSTLFSNIESITVLHTDLLQSLVRVVEGDLPELSRHGPRADSIPQVMLKWDHLACLCLTLRRYSSLIANYYRDFLANYENMISTLETLRKNKKFNAFMARCKEDPRCNRQDITSFFILPVQRVPRCLQPTSEIEVDTHLHRYELLLKDLRQRTCPFDPRAGPCCPRRLTNTPSGLSTQTLLDINRALQAVNSVCRTINERKRQVHRHAAHSADRPQIEQLTRVLEIQRSIQSSKVC